MPVGEIEEITEGRRGGGPIGEPGVRAPAQEREAAELLDDLVFDLSRHLGRLSAERRDLAVRATLETLGRGLGADRVHFLRTVAAADEAAAPVFETEQVWRSTDAGPTPADLPSSGLEGVARGAVAERLRAGEVVVLPGSPPWRSAPLASPRGAPAEGSRGAADRALVPCLGSAGWLGLLVIEGGSRWRGCGPPLRRRMLEAAGWLVAFLERARLCDALEASRSAAIHDERLETLGRVASSVVHDLNNVLTAIQGYGELLERTLPEDAPGRADLAEIQAAAGRATMLLQQVLDFGRRRPSGVERLDVRATIESLAGMMRRLLGPAVDLELALESLPPIRIDPLRFEQVLLNLAANARDAVAAGTRARGRFRLESRLVSIDARGRDRDRASEGSAAPREAPAPRLAPGQYLRLTARDDGCGIDPSIQERLFEPFFTTKPRGVGSGLGLATVAEVVREAGGALAVESERGRGTRLHLYLPCLSVRDAHEVGHDLV